MKKTKKDEFSLDDYDPRIVRAMGLRLLKTLYPTEYYTKELWKSEQSFLLK